MMTNQEKIVEFLKNSGMYYLATVDGELVHDDTVEARKKVLDAQPELRTAYHYDENDGVCAVFYFKRAKAVTYSFTSEPETIEI